ncbi:MAG: orotidine-5'-phosphate decarboxylase [Deltaproteobacteria bacterium]|nr:orotidine-5'-phosphate decarboxylase [Deltaproteobacteria bacterium]
MFTFHPLPETPRDRLIFALDVDDLDTAERYVRMLAPHVGLFKVGPILYTSAGPMVLDLIHGSGAGCFLDLKFHDIPATVASAAREAARRRVRMFTVHALGGRKMIEGASSELMRMTVVPGVPRPMCLGVTILTSHDEADLAEIGLPGPIAAQGLRLARLAVSAGAAGIVASARELASLRAQLPPSTLFVTPGIRGAKDPHGDQARVVSAREAIEAGATYLVVGRPIRDASDPAGAAQRILDEIGAARAS